MCLDVQLFLLQKTCTFFLWQVGTKSLGVWYHSHLQLSRMIWSWLPFGNWNCRNSVDVLLYFHVFLWLLQALGCFIANTSSQRRVQLNRSWVLSLQANRSQHGCRKIMCKPIVCYLHPKYIFKKYFIYINEKPKKPANGLFLLNEVSCQTALKTATI